MGWARLLLEADHLAALVELSHAELARVRHLGQHDLRIRPRPAELFDQRGDTADDEVVAEIHDEVVVTEEVSGDQHRVRQAERRFLRDVADAQPEGRAVTHRLPDGRRGVTYHHADVCDACVADGLEAVEENRLVRYREQLLGRGVRDGSEPGTRTPRQDQGFHAANLTPPVTGRQDSGRKIDVCVRRRSPRIHPALRRSPVAGRVHSGPGRARGLAVELVLRRSHPGAE